MNLRAILMSSLVMLAISVPAWATTVVTKEELDQYKEFVRHVKTLKAKGEKVGLYIGRVPSEEQPPSQDPTNGDKVTWFTAAFSGHPETTDSHLKASLGGSLSFKYGDEEIDLEKELKDAFDLISFDWGTIYSASSGDGLSQYGILMNKDHGKVLMADDGEIGGNQGVPFLFKKGPNTYHAYRAIGPGCDGYLLEDFEFTAPQVGELFELVGKFSSYFLSDEAGARHEKLDKKTHEEAKMLALRNYLGKYFRSIEYINTDFFLRNKPKDGFVLRDPIRKE